MIRKDFSLLSISIRATKNPLSFFSKYCRIKISPRKAYLYLPFGENQRDFQSRRMPKRCEYGCTVWVMLFFACPAKPWRSGDFFNWHYLLLPLAFLANFFQCFQRIPQCRQWLQVFLHSNLQPKQLCLALFLLPLVS